jgi:hypothetical protein
VYGVHEQVYDVSLFEKLADKYETLSWRMISKPGGATVKPDDYYNLYACVDSDGASNRKDMHATGVVPWSNLGRHKLIICLLCAIYKRVLNTMRTR